MYPSPQTPIASTSGFVPRPSSRFQPITPAAPSQGQMPDAVSQQIEPQSNGISPGSSLPCGQGTTTALVSSTSIPSQHKETYMPPQLVIPPQPSTPHSPNNTHHQKQYRQPCGMLHISPIRQPRQQLPLRTQINPSTQHFIPAAVAHQTVPGSPGQGTSKSVNGEGVKNSRQ